MKPIPLICFLACCVAASGTVPNEGDGRFLHWEKEATLPSPPFPHTDVVLGEMGGGLLVTGRYSDSEGAPYRDEAWLYFPGEGEGEPGWKGPFETGKELGDGATAPLEGGLLHVGGLSEGGPSAAVFMLRWNTERETVERVDWPSLPVPVAHPAIARIGDRLYVAGAGSGDQGRQPVFFALDISDRADLRSKSRKSARVADDGEEPFSWISLPAWPGAGREQAVLVSQHDGFETALYLMGGYSAGEGEKRVYSESVFAYYPGRSGGDRAQPEEKAPWVEKQPLPAGARPLQGYPVGQSHLFLFGREKRPAADADNHGQAAVWIYHTITDTWIREKADWVGGVPLATSPRDKSFRVFTSHENELERWKASPVQNKRTFGENSFAIVGNSAVLVFYLLIVLGTGIWFKRRNKNTNDYFRGGQRVPWLIAGLSIFATVLSSITFMAIPAKSYATNWVYIITSWCTVLVVPIVIYFILPFFRKIDATSAYEYLEMRFNVGARILGSVFFMLFHIGRMAIVLFLPALALATVTPIGVMECILIMGALSIVYCTLGGFEAVAWTDAIQTLVLFLGILISMGVVITALDGGIGEWVAVARADRKLRMMEWDWGVWSMTTTALWVVVLGGFGQQLTPLVSDQAVVQRYLSTQTNQQARRTLWLQMAMSIPTSLLFFGMGTALYVFYKANPERLEPTLQTDAIFPLFIANELPPILSGLVVAGVFAAAQSTVSTSMNSAATSLITDIFRRLQLFSSEAAYFRAAKGATVFFGTLGCGLALLFAAADVLSLWDQFMRVLGLFGGAMAGLFLLGMLTRRANGPGALIGVVGGVLVTFVVQRFTGVHLLLHATVGMTSCLALGYTASAFFHGTPSRTDGLTIHTMSGAQVELQESSRPSP